MYLAIDIGGTKTLLALFSNHGLCLKRLKFPTEKDPRAFETSLYKNLATFVKSPFFRSRVRAITVAIPGVVKVEQNFCSFKFGNLDWPNIELITPIKKLFNCKIFFANDANLATLYESTRFRRKSGKSVYLTFSTGIGGGISENGHLLNSSNAFEPGHIKYTYKNRLEEWEDLASAKALVEAYNIPTLQNLPLSDPETLNDLINRLSLGLLDIIEQESPALIIVGGPLGLIFKRFVKSLIPALKMALRSQNSRSKALDGPNSVTNASAKKVPREAPILPKFVKARRPTESVIYGAYLYSKQNWKK